MTTRISPHPSRLQIVKTFLRGLMPSVPSIQRLKASSDPTSHLPKAHVHRLEGETASQRILTAARQKSTTRFMGSYAPDCQTVTSAMAVSVTKLMNST